MNIPVTTRAPVRSSSRGVGFGGGITSFFGGVGFVFVSPAVWPFAAVPIVTAALVLGALGALGVWGAVSAASSLVGGGGGEWSSAARTLLEILFGAVALVVSALVALAVAQPLSGWALDRIVARQESELGLPLRAPLVESRASQMVRSLGVSFLALAVAVPVLGGLTLLDVVVPAAAIVAVPIKFVVGALLVAWDLLDYPLSLRGMSIGARVRWIGRHFGAVMGFGLSAALILLMPCVGLLVLPMGAAGAARLVARTERDA